MFNYPKDKDLVFVDLEANDKPKRLLQFGAVKLKTDGSVNELCLFSNPKCELSNHVKSIVKNNIDQIMNGENNTKIMKKISKFISNCVFISYSSFDYFFLNKLNSKLFNEELNCEFIDLQNEWKNRSGSKNVWSLKKLANLFKININDDNFHDALYDSKILYEIFLKWKEMDDNKISFLICKNRIENDSQIKIKNNKNQNNCSTLNNLDFNNGYVFLDLTFKSVKIYNNDIKEKILTDLSIIEIQNNMIKKNWFFNYEINQTYFSYQDYLKELIVKLKKYIMTIKYKKIVILEHNFHDLIRLCNLCSKHIRVFPLNKIIFCNGFELFFNEIDFFNYRFQPNSILIKRWLVLNYLLNIMNLTIK